MVYPDMFQVCREQSFVWEVLNGQKEERYEVVRTTDGDMITHLNIGVGGYLAFYQWKSKKSFKEIKKYLPMDTIYKLYPTLHEASEEKFVDIANAIFERKKLPVKLQTVRKAIGLTQKELAEKSGVKLRMIQQYEQRAKDINKATTNNLFALAQVLGCKAEDLLE